MKNVRAFLVVIAGLMITGILFPMNELNKKNKHSKGSHKRRPSLAMFYKSFNKEHDGFNKKVASVFKNHDKKIVSDSEDSKFDGKIQHKSKSKNLDSEGSSESSDSE